MSLSRVTTWIAGQILTADNLNSEFDNILSNPITLVSPTTGAINFNLKAHTNFVLENVGASPSAATAGRIVWNTAYSRPEYDDSLVIRAGVAIPTTDLAPGDLIAVSSAGVISRV